MISPALLLEDHHVHSTFSDGTSSPAQNVEQAERLGLLHLGCVDHVRVDTTYVPDYAAAIEALRPATSVVLTVGIEAKVLDVEGRLDMPDSGLEGVDRVYVADHQFPWHDGPQSPRVVKGWLETGESSAEQCIEMLTRATVASMHRYRRHPLVLAHLFSILPKVGLSEDQVSDALLETLARAAADTATIVEVSERWRCPSIRMIRAARAAGARVVCSTDSHALATLGRYTYVRGVIEALTT